MPENQTPAADAANITDEQLANQEAPETGADNAPKVDVPTLTYSEKDKPVVTYFEKDQGKELEDWIEARQAEGFDVQVTDSAENLAEGWRRMAYLKNNSETKQLDHVIVIIGVPGVGSVTQDNIDAMLKEQCKKIGSRLLTAYKKANTWAHIEFPFTVAEFMPGRHGSPIKRAMNLLHWVYATKLKKENRLDLLLTPDDLRTVLSNADFAKMRMRGIEQEFWEELLDKTIENLDVLVDAYNAEKSEGKEDYTDMVVSVETLQQMRDTREDAVYTVEPAAFSW